MDCQMLKAADILSPYTGIHYAQNTSSNSSAKAHCHDFFEIFLVTDGEVIHYINGASQLLRAGTLIFIRSDDVHYYNKSRSEFKFINIAFTEEIMQSIFDFLQDNNLKESLLTAHTPPAVYLSETETGYLLAGMDKLNVIPQGNNNVLKFQIKAFLCSLIANYFAADIMDEEQKPDNTIPKWLSCLMAEMKEKNNFIEGIPKMVELSNKTQEHVTRSFKKYLGITPSYYLNELKLIYAANLLLKTDLNILDISLQSGFGSLGYFNHMFKNKFSMPPRSFRKIYKTQYPMV